MMIAESTLPKRPVLRIIVTIIFLHSYFRATGGRATELSLTQVEGVVYLVYLRDCLCQLQAIMRPMRHFQLLKLDVVIRDINDNPPVFPSDVIIVNVTENARVNNVISISSQQAADDDAGADY